MNTDPVIEKAKENIHEKLRMEEIGLWLFGSPDPRRWLCPCHNDHHPGSVAAYDEGRRFHCFSCGADGDVITLVMKKKHCTFPWAVYLIAAQFDGIVNEQEFSHLAQMLHGSSCRMPESIPEKEGMETDEVQRAPAYILDMVYRIFIQGRSLLYPCSGVLTLNDYRYLRNRGIEDTVIRENQYFTMMDETILPPLIQKLAERNYSEDILIGVPGFYRDRKSGSIRMAVQKGIGIPIHDVWGNITAIQIRRSTSEKTRYIWYSSASAGHPERMDGVSSGSPQDVLCGKDDNARDILITEGHFKADAFRRYGHMSAISVQGIASCRDIDGPLRQLIAQKHKTCRILIGFDSDMYTNPAVYHQAVKLADDIVRQNLPAVIVYLFWNSMYGKGLDDVLQNHYENEIHMAEKEDFEAVMSHYEALTLHTDEERKEAFQREVIDRLSQRYLPGE